VAYNREALEALAFPQAVDELELGPSHLARHIGERLTMSSSTGSRKFVSAFKSGNRTYICRAIKVSLDDSSGGAWSHTTLVLLERSASPSRLLERKAAEDFALTRRERQIVELLIHGMTTKEMAQVLNLSPNTVKSFLRLVMTKMGVTTRSGIVGKLLRPRAESRPGSAKNSRPSS
jgi:DNA-binding CsgD family transcriptional regulator